MIEDWELLVNINHPWNKFALGWEYIPVDDEDPYKSFFLHLGFLTIIFNWN